MRFLIVVYCVAVLTGAASAQEGAKDANPLPLDKWNLKLLEEKYPMKIKSVSYDGKDTFRFLAEFTKDVSEPLERTAMIQAFNQGELRKKMPKFYFYFLDADNVVLRYVTPDSLEGTLTFTAGDAFRFLVKIDQPIASKATRVETRPKK